VVEQDVIGHLIDVERLASDLLLDAQTEVDRRKAIAKETAERAYLTAYEQIIAELEESSAAGKKECDASRERDYAAFNDHLASIHKDQAAFKACLDSIFFG